MDTGEAIQQFCAMTEADTDFAVSFLQENGWNVEYCINLYLEGNFGGNAGTPKLGGLNHQGSSPGGANGGVSAGASFSASAGPRSSSSNERTLSDADIARAMSEEIPPEIYSDNAMVDDDEVRAPILPRSETLVEDDPYSRLRRRPKPAGGDPNNVFVMFRDLNRESRAARGGDDPYNKKLKTLADIFRPPLDLIQFGSFDDVKNITQSKKKWLLVNIQEEAEFECQMMNRDTWSDEGVKSIVKSHFVLWQVLKTSDEGARYCRFYPVEILPHIAVIDSRTGERLDVVEGFIKPAALIEMLERFVQAHSFDDNKPISRPKARSPKRLGDLSEEAQLAAAMAASLGQAADPIPEDFNSSSPPSTSTSTSTSASTSSTTFTSTTSTINETAPTTTTTSSASTPSSVAPSTPPPTPATPPPVAEQKVAEPAKPAAPPIPANFKEEHANPSPERSCVIQVRMPSGPIKGHFKPDDTLFTVWQYVSLHLGPDTQFSLVTSFPKNTYSGEKLNMTLKQAELVPRAVLICELN